MEFVKAYVLSLVLFVLVGTAVVLVFPERGGEADAGREVWSLPGLVLGTHLGVAYAAGMFLGRRQNEGGWPAGALLGALYLATLAGFAWIFFARTPGLPTIALLVGAAAAGALGSLSSQLFLLRAPRRRRR
ncbi:MAG: hypothetical protein IMX03_04770 [Brockia lithotrophica]|nr:hypothetical protein [Brockia lithotrophica]